MKIVKSISLLTLSSVLLLASPEVSKEKQLQQIVATGDATAKILLKTLSSNLQEHMQNGGVMDAFAFCSNEAYPLTEKINKELEKGVSVKRISTQFRSPVNAPKSDEKAVLERLKTMQANNTLPPYILEQTDKKTFKYYKPLVIEKDTCLKCHGKIENDSELAKVLVQRYPLDTAIDYKMNDIRGAVVVTITKE